MADGEDIGSPPSVMLALHQGSGSGSVNSVLRLALGLRAAGVQVLLVCPPDSPIERDARAGLLEVHPLPLARQSRLQNAGDLRTLLANHPVHLVNSQGSRDREAFTWLALTRRLGVPLVLTRRSYPRSTRLETWLAGRAADRVIALSEPVAQVLIRQGTPAGKISIIHNGLLTDRIDQPVTAAALEQWRARIGWEPSRRTVGIVARPKDQAVVLEALQSVQTPVRLVLAGLDGAALNGPLPPVPERHAVVRLPFDPDIRPLYDLLEVALHPSRFDAFPQAVLEALALGKPVIASHASGNAVIIRDGLDGLLVEPEAPKAWASALDRVLQDGALARRLAQSGVRRAREDFPFQRTIQQTLQVYRSVLLR